MNGSQIWKLTGEESYATNYKKFKKIYNKLMLIEKKINKNSDNFHNNYTRNLILATYLFPPAIIMTGPLYLAVLPFVLLSDVPNILIYYYNKNQISSAKLLWNLESKYCKVVDDATQNYACEQKNYFEMMSSGSFLKSDNLLKSCDEINDTISDKCHDYLEKFQQINN